MSISFVIFPDLFHEKWPDTEEFLEKILDHNHLMWGPGGAGREFSRLTLLQYKDWYWLAFRVDDFAGLIEESMLQKLPKWIWRAKFEIGGLYKHSHSTREITIWLMKRYMSELQNLFDKRYKNYIPINHVMIVPFIDTSVHTAIWSDETIYSWEE